MADIEPPSFFLDLDFDAEPQLCDPPPPSPPSPPACRPLWEQDEEDLELQVKDSEDEDEKPLSTVQINTTPLFNAPQILKRLRRVGVLPIQEPKTKLKNELGSLPSQISDGDIEDFSSEDDDFVADLVLPSRDYNSACSSSKASLGGSGVLTPQPSAQTISKLKGKAFDLPASSSLETGHSGLVFPKSTASSLRRFRLNDSDEEPAKMNRKPAKVVSQSTRQCSSTATGQRGNQQQVPILRLRTSGRTFVLFKVLPSRHLLWMHSAMSIFNLLKIRSQLQDVEMVLMQITPYRIIIVIIRIPVSWWNQNKARRGMPIFPSSSLFLP